MTKITPVYVVLRTVTDPPDYLETQRTTTRDPFRAWTFSEPENAQRWGQAILFAGFTVLKRYQLTPITTGLLFGQHSAYSPDHTTTPPHNPRG